MYLTVQEASRMLGICRHTLRINAKRMGITTHWTAGGHRRFLLSEVEQAVQRSTVRPVDRK